MIRVHTLTEATGEDTTTALDLLTAVEGPLVRVTADAAYDTVAVYGRQVHDPDMKSSVLRPRLLYVAPRPVKQRPSSKSGSDQAINREANEARFPVGSLDTPDRTFAGASTGRA